jgi:hypothetical protein
MRCLYCNKRLWLSPFRQSSFCSKLHEIWYQEEQAGEAIRRLVTDLPQPAPRPAKRQEPPAEEPAFEPPPPAGFLVEWNSVQPPHLFEPGEGDGPEEWPTQIAWPVLGILAVEEGEAPAAEPEAQGPGEAERVAEPPLAPRLVQWGTPVAPPGLEPLPAEAPIELAVAVAPVLIDAVPPVRTNAAPPLRLPAPALALPAKPRIAAEAVPAGDFTPTPFPPVLPSCPHGPATPLLSTVAPTPPAPKPALGLRSFSHDALFDVPPEPLAFDQAASIHLPPTPLPGAAIGPSARQSVPEREVVPLASGGEAKPAARGGVDSEILRQVPAKLPWTIPARAAKVWRGRPMGALFDAARFPIRSPRLPARSTSLALDQSALATLEYHAHAVPPAGSGAARGAGAPPASMSFETKSFRPSGPERGACVLLQASAFPPAPGFVALPPSPRMTPGPGEAALMASEQAPLGPKFEPGRGALRLAIHHVSSHPPGLAAARARLRMAVTPSIDGPDVRIPVPHVSPVQTPHPRQATGVTPPDHWKPPVPPPVDPALAAGLPEKSGWRLPELPVSASAAPFLRQLGDVAQLTIMPSSNTRGGRPRLAEFREAHLALAHPQAGPGRAPELHPAVAGTLWWEIRRRTGGMPETGVPASAYLREISTKPVVPSAVERSAWVQLARSGMRPLAPTGGGDLKPTITGGMASPEELRPAGTKFPRVRLAAPSAHPVGTTPGFRLKFGGQFKAAGDAPACAGPRWSHGTSHIVIATPARVMRRVRGLPCGPTWSPWLAARPAAESQPVTPAVRFEPRHRTPAGPLRPV